MIEEVGFEYFENKCGGGPQACMFKTVISLKESKSKN